jgi:hypothetical protein
MKTEIQTTNTQLTQKQVSEQHLKSWRNVANSLNIAFGNKYSLELHKQNKSPDLIRAYKIFKDLEQELSYNYELIEFTFNDFCKEQQHFNFTYANIRKYIPKAYTTYSEAQKNIEDATRITTIVNLTTRNNAYCDFKHLGILSYAYEVKKLLKPVYGANTNEKFIALLFGLFRDAETQQKDFQEYANDLQLLLNDFNVNVDSVELLSTYLNSLIGGECNVVTGLMQIHRAKGWHYD